MVHDEFSVHEMDKSFFLAHTQAEIKILEKRYFPNNIANNCAQEKIPLLT